MQIRQFLHANQFHIIDDEGNQFFQSYDSIICKFPINKSNVIILDYNTWNCSNTTTRHLHKFLPINLLTEIKKAEKKQPFENNKEYTINNGYRDFIIQFTNLN